MSWTEIDNIREETHEDGLREWQIDYDKEKGMYRVSEFLNNHFINEVIFDEIEKENANAYCPVCNTDRWIPDVKGYCCKCGHRLKNNNTLFLDLEKGLRQAIRRMKMSNEYKEWKKDREEEAWYDILKIAEIAELDNHANTEECFYKIVNILKEGGWI